MGLFSKFFRDTSRDDEFLRLCARGTFQEVSNAVNSWAYVGAKGKSGQTALMSASLNSDANVMKLLLAELKKQNINIINAHDSLGMTALHVAASYSNNPAIINLLANAGANFTMRDRNGQTPLMLAVSTVINDLEHNAYRDNTEVIRALLSRGTQSINFPDLKGNTPLHVAAMMSPNPNIIRILVDAGANIEAADSTGATPIFSALMHPNPVMLKALIDAGADVEHIENDGFTPLMSAIASLANGHTSINHVKVLIDAMIFFEDFDPNGATALIYAAQLTSYPEVVKMLIDAGADPNEEDFNGHTALDWAIHVHNSAAVSMLRARGARSNL